MASNQLEISVGADSGGILGDIDLGIFGGGSGRSEDIGTDTVKHLSPNIAHVALPSVASAQARITAL